MSLLWEQQMEREMEERYSEWKQKEMDRTIDSFDEHPLTLDWTWQAYERDYGKPGIYPTPKDATTHLLAIFGISGVLLALFIVGVNYVSKVVAR